MKQAENQPALWSRNLIVLMLVNFSSALSFYLIMVKITQFSIDTYGVSESVAGLMITAYVISALIARLAFGGRIDAWGIKRSIAIGSTINAASMLLYLVPMDFIPLIAVRALHGVGFAIMSGAAASGVALVIPRERYGEGIGYYAMMQALATGIGPFVAIMLTSTLGGYFWMFAVAAAFAVAASFSVLLLRIPEEGRASKHQNLLDEIRVHGIGALVQLSAVPLASVLFLAYLGYAGILSFVAAFAAERGLTDAVSVYFVVYAAVILATRPPVGRRLDRRGENSTMYLCTTSLAIGLVMLALSTNAVVLLASAVFVGFGVGATQSIIQAVIARDSAPDELGKSNSTFFMSMDLGSGIGPVAIGALIPVIGYSASYLVLAGVAVLAIANYHLVHGRFH